jgi:hypothetical protein
MGAGPASGLSNLVSKSRSSDWFNFTSNCLAKICVQHILLEHALSIKK